MTCSHRRAAFTTKLVVKVNSFMSESIWPKVAALAIPLRPLLAIRKAELLVAPTANDRLIQYEG
jgi:hypothetical protein